jgi:hypothetical protein
VKGYTPFLIVIGLLQLAPIGPFTTFHELASRNPALDDNEASYLPCQGFSDARRFMARVRRWPFSSFLYTFCVFTRLYLRLG